MPKSLITHCNHCLRETNHLIIFCKRNLDLKVNEDEMKSDIDTSVKEDFLTLQCKGCDNLSFLLRNSGEVFNEADGTVGFYDINYPSSKWTSEFNLLSDDEQRQLPRLLADLYEQLEIAFDNDANTLAGVGLRMMVEAICMEQEIKGNNLKTKIEGLLERGLISKNEMPILDKLREIGNFSAHQIIGFSIDKLTYALEIINHVLKSIYILPKIEKKLARDLLKKSSPKKDIIVQRHSNTA
ncbi:MAG: hypothetical protein JWP69_1690 [Flaviaesturariibacter sp.]|nr:hypothetical protein [Flaviaesturariibacter sp.]